MASNNKFTKTNFSYTKSTKNVLSRISNKKIHFQLLLHTRTVHSMHSRATVET